MSSKSAPVRNVLIRAVVSILLISGGYAGLRTFGTKARPAARPAAEDTGIAVETARVESFDGPFTIEADGVAVPHRIVTISSEVSGRVVHKSENVLGGRLVVADDVLFQIDDENYGLEVDLLKAQVTQSEEAIRAIDLDIVHTQHLIELANEDLALEDRNVRRVADLIRRGAGTEADVDAAERTRLTRRNSLQTLTNQLAAQRQQRRSLEASLTLAEVQKKQAELALSRTTIRADMTGTIVTTQVEEGDYVSGGTPLVQISDSTKAEVRVDLRVDQLAWVWLQGRGTAHFASASERALVELPPTPVDVVFELDESEIVWSGMLNRYEGTGLEETTRTVPCRVLVDQPTEAELRTSSATPPPICPPALLRGMYVRIRIPIQSDVSLVRLPRLAVRPGGLVYVNVNNTLRILPIDVVREDGNAVLVRLDSTELRPGDEVITSPLAAIREGMSLRVVEPQGDFRVVIDNEPDKGRVDGTDTTSDMVPVSSGRTEGTQTVQEQHRDPHSESTPAEQPRTATTPEALNQPAG